MPQLTSHRHRTRRPSSVRLKLPPVQPEESRAGPKPCPGAPDVASVLGVEARQPLRRAARCDRRSNASHAGFPASGEELREHALAQSLAAADAAPQGHRHARRARDAGKRDIETVLRIQPRSRGEHARVVAACCYEFALLCAYASSSQHSSSCRSPLSSPRGRRRAQAYPAKPVRMIVPFAPGGTTDILGAPRRQKIARSWAAGGRREPRRRRRQHRHRDHRARRPPTATRCSSARWAHAITDPLPKMPYDPVSDFAPISLVANVALVLVVHPSLPAKNVSELVALAKREARPAQLRLRRHGSSTSCAPSFSR